MGVLAAVLAHAGDIALDVAGIMRGIDEGRCEQAHDAVGFRDQLFLHRVHGLFRPRARRRAGDDRPGLGQGVDAALRITVATERRAVVVIGAAVPGAIPAACLQGIGETVTVLAVTGEARPIVAAFAQRQEVAENLIQEKPEPDALAAPFPSDAVHTVVPVARAHQRQAVFTAGERAVEGAATVLVEVGGFRTGFRAADRPRPRRVPAAARAETAHIPRGYRHRR